MLPVLMASSVVRRLVWSSVKREMPDLIVISEKEILSAGTAIKVDVLGEVQEEKGVTL